VLHSELYLSLDHRVSLGRLTFLRTWRFTRKYVHNMVEWLNGMRSSVVRSNRLSVRRWTLMPLYVRCFPPQKVYFVQYVCTSGRLLGTLYVPGTSLRECTYVFRRSFQSTLLLPPSPPPRIACMHHAPHERATLTMN
jgi:hypothetical protein